MINAQEIPYPISIITFTIKEISIKFCKNLLEVFKM